MSCNLLPLIWQSVLEKYFKTLKYLLNKYHCAPVYIYALYDVTTQIYVHFEQSHIGL